MHRKFRQHIGFLANLAFTLTSVLGVFLMTPLIIRNYGQGVYLLWSLVNSACGLLFILDFGITSVIAREFLEVFKEATNFSRRIWKRFLVFHGKILFTGAGFVILIFIFQSNMGHVFKFSYQNLLIFLFTLLATLATIASHQQVIKFQVIGNYPRALIIIALAKIIETVIIFLMLYSEFSFVIITLLVAAIHIFQLLILTNVSNRQLSESEITASAGQNNELRKLSFISSVLYSASSVLGIHATFLVQSFFLSPKQLLIVLISRMISSPIRIIADSIAIGSFDKYIRKSLSNQAKKLPAKHSPVEPWLMLLGFSVIYVTLLNLVGKFIFGFLSHGQSTANLLLLNLFCLATLLDGAIVIYMQILISSGSLGNAGSLYFLITLVSFLFLASVILQFGVYAGVISIIVCDLLFFLFELRAKIRLNQS